MNRTSATYKILFSLLSFTAFFCLSAQDDKQPEQAFLISPSISIQYAGGDFADRFENNFTAGLGFGIKTTKNWIFSVNGHFMFGNNVKNPEGLLNSLITADNKILNQTGNFAQLSILQRGFYVLGEGEKLFNQLGVNKNSGLSLSLGAGFINHWILFKNAGEDSPQILEDYRKGYDRYSGGFLLKQSIGYTYLSSNHRINFKISFEVLEAYTKNYREFNYDTGQTDLDQHLDLLYGIRFNWYLPIYKKPADQFYYD